MQLEGAKASRQPVTAMPVGAADSAPTADSAKPAEVLGGPGVTVSAASGSPMLPPGVDPAVISAMIESAFATLRHIAENMGVSEEEAARKAERKKQQDEAEALKEELKRLQADLAEKKISAEMAYVKLQSLRNGNEQWFADVQHLAGLALPV